jgi:hypothetical protein
MIGAVGVLLDNPGYKAESQRQTLKVLPHLYNNSALRQLEFLFARYLLVLPTLPRVPLHKLDGVAMIPQSICSSDKHND